jgi:hypothetical protein
LVKQFSCSLDNDSEVLASLELLGTNLDTIVPDANNENDILDLHLLKQVEKLFSGSILAIIVKTLGHDLSLGDLV